MITSPACAAASCGSGSDRSVSVIEDPQCVAESLRQHVVRELLEHPLGATAVPSPPAATSSSSRRRTRRRRPGRPPGRRSTRPVSPSTTASAAPPESPATCGTPHAAASTNTMPNPSCSRPPQRFRHSIVKMSAQPYRQRQVVVRDPPEEPHRRIELGREPLQTIVVTAAAGDHEEQVGAHPPEPGRRPDRRVESLARHEPGDADDQLGVVRDVEVIGVRRAVRQRSAGGTARRRPRTARP